MTLYGATFRSLGNSNYRIWAAGAFVSNVGTWMQRVTQDWLVLTELTHNRAADMGLVMALQFAPQLLLLPLTGAAADYFDRRKLLLATQTLLGLLALSLGALTLSGKVQVWHVDLFALALGCVTAFDAPARQTFVAELVGEADLANAVALNSASFNLGRMIGPAIAGMLIAAIGSGWVFILNASTFTAVVISLQLIRVEALHTQPKFKGQRGGLGDGLRYIAKRRDLQAALAMLFLIGTFGLNFPIYISTMAVTVFHSGSSEFGLLTSTMAIGSIGGALLSAKRAMPSLRLLFGSATAFGCGCVLAAVSPDYRLFAIALVLTGVSLQTVTTSTNSLVQLSCEPVLRGRVVAIMFAVALGGIPIGAPLVGYVADKFGARWGLGVASAAGFAAAAVALWHRISSRRRIMEAPRHP